MYFLGDLVGWEGKGEGLRGRQGWCSTISLEAKRPEIKNVIYISTVVHENKVASFLPSPEARAAPCHLFLIPPSRLRLLQTLLCNNMTDKVLT